jgi:hypothetical protein
MTLSNDLVVNESNFTTRFVTNLDSKLTLNKDYEVALTEVILEDCFHLNLGEIKYIYGTNEISTEIRAEDNQSIKEIVDQYSNELRNLYAKKEHQRRYEIYKRLLSENNPQGYIIEDGLFIKLPTSTEYEFDVEYDILHNKSCPKIRVKDNFVVHEHGKNGHFEYTGDIGKYIDCINYVTIKSDTKVEILKKKIHSLQSSYILCDLVEEQQVGEDSVQLLRNLCTPNNAEIVQLIYQNPYYLKVNKQVIENITINLRSKLNEVIEFNQGSIKLVLHFRPRFKPLA